MILNLRGTSGSGKTTVARRILSEYDSEPIMGMVPGGKKERIVGYQIGNLWIPGSYENTCGGVDTYSWKGAADYLEEKVRLVAANGYHVLFEGLVQTAGNKRWTGVANDFPLVWAFLDTPLEKCIERVLERNGGREGKNNWFNLRASYDDCMQQRSRLQNLGLNFVIIEHQRAFEQVVGILEDAGWRASKVGERQLISSAT